MSSGHIVYGREGQLWAVGFDLGSLTVVGDPVPVVDDVPTAENGAGLFAVADGSLVYGTTPPAAAESGQSLMWVDRTGREEPLDLLIVKPAIDHPRLSHDDERAVYHISGSGPQAGVVWVVELASGRRIDVSTDPSLAGGFNMLPHWAPDDSQIMFTSGPYSGSRTVVSVSPDGTGVPDRKLYREGVVGLTANGFGPDGAILTKHDSPDNGADIGVLWPDDRWEPLLDSSADERFATVSPNGRWVAYTSDETGVREVYVQRFPELGRKTPISTGGGMAAVWSPLGDELFYLVPRNATPSIGGRTVSSGLVSVPVDTGPSLVVGVPQVLFATDAYDVSILTRDYDVAQDASRFLMVTRAQGAPRDVIYVQNWTEDLKRLVPID